MATVGQGNAARAHRSMERSQREEVDMDALAGAVPCSTTRPCGVGLKTQVEQLAACQTIERVGPGSPRQSEGARSASDGLGVVWAAPPPGIHLAIGMQLPRARVAGS